MPTPTSTRRSTSSGPVGPNRSNPVKSHSQSDPLPNYGAAKAGIAALTVILAQELERYGVRVNAIAPVARTRMTEAVAGIADVVRAPDDPRTFDTYHPGNVSPVVAWLATTDCPLSGQILYIRGGEVRVMEGWRYGRSVDRGDRRTISTLGTGLAPPG